MAYTASNSRSNSNADTFEKAKAFVNLSIPRINADGSQGRFKLVGIPLREGNPAEKTLLDWLQKDPANVGKLTAKLQADFQLVNPAGAGVLCLD